MTGTVLPFFHYLGTRSARALYAFLRNWYEGGAVLFEEHLFSTLRRFDRVLALRITVRYFFTPLYNDRTFIGYVLGVIFRSIRIMIACVIYSFVIFAYILVAFIWFAFPLFGVYKIITSL